VWLQPRIRHVNWHRDRQHGLAMFQSNAKQSSAFGKGCSPARSASPSSHPRADRAGDRLTVYRNIRLSKALQRLRITIMKPSIKKYSKSTMTVLMLAVFVMLLAIATRYPAEARFMAFVIGLPAVALLLLQILLDGRRPRRDFPDLITAARCHSPDRAGVRGRSTECRLVSAPTSSYRSDIKSVIKRGPTDT
jgi:hypothetical protein